MNQSYKFLKNKMFDEQVLKYIDGYQIAVIKFIIIVNVQILTIKIFI